MKEYYMLENVIDDINDKHTIGRFNTMASDGWVLHTYLHYIDNNGLKKFRAIFERTVINQQLPK